MLKFGEKSLEEGPFDSMFFSDAERFVFGVLKGMDGSDFAGTVCLFQNFHISSMTSS